MGSNKTIEHDVCEVTCHDEVVVERVGKILEEADLSPVVHMFKALADETRMKIIYALKLEGELCVCDVANIVQASTATASHHLRLLKTQGLAKMRKEGKLAYYSLDDDHVSQLVELALIHSKEGNCDDKRSS